MLLTYLGSLVLKRSPLYAVTSANQTALVTKNFYIIYIFIAHNGRILIPASESHLVHLLCIINSHPPFSQLFYLTFQHSHASKSLFQ